MSLCLKNSVLSDTASKNIGTGVEVFFKYLCLYYEVLCNITQILIKTNWCIK